MAVAIMDDGQQYLFVFVVIIKEKGHGYAKVIQETEKRKKKEREREMHNWIVTNDFSYVSYEREEKRGEEKKKIDGNQGGVFYLSVFWFFHAVRWHLFWLGQQCMLHTDRGLPRFFFAPKNTQASCPE